MRPVTVEHVVSQYFAQMPTAGVRGDIKAVGTVAYYVALYGNYQPHGHAGMDFKCPIGTPIYAMADGTVLYAGWSEDLPGTGEVRKWLLYYNFGGIITVIQHDGWISITAHQSTNDAVHVGMAVKRGQLIGKSGDTKTRTSKVAPHVHVEALIDLRYRTGGGLIYGRTDPSKFFTGGITAHSTTTTSEEDFMATPEERAALIKDLLFTPVEQPDGTFTTLNETIAEARSHHLQIVENKPTINPRQAEDIVQATVSRINATADGKVINAQQADDIATAAARYAKEQEATNG